VFYSAFRKTASFSLSRRGVSVFLAALYLLFQSVKAGLHRHTGDAAAVAPAPDREAVDVPASSWSSADSA